MVYAPDFGRTVAEELSKATGEASFEIDASAMTADEIASVVDGIIGECGSRGVALKCVEVDASLMPLPDDAAFQNAFARHGQWIVLSTGLSDRIVVRRR